MRPLQHLLRSLRIRQGEFEGEDTDIPAEYSTHMAAQLMAMVMGSGGIASARGRLKGGSGFRMLMRARVEAGAAAAAAGWGVIVVDGGAVGNGGVGAGDDAGGSVAKL